MIQRLKERPFLAGGLLAAAVVGGTLLVSGGPGPSDGTQGVDRSGHVYPGQPVQTRDLLFKDRADGSVAVFEAGGDRPIAVLPSGNEYGFIRVVLRGMARDRRGQGIGPDEPFRVTRWSDGRVSLEDTATGRLVELTAFGATNAGAFARFLDAEAAAEAEGDG